MARIRTIKPEFWSDEDLCEQPEATHMLAAALLNYADDFGYFNANPKLVQASCCPLREPSVSIPESLRRLQTIGYIRLGTGDDGRRYGQVCGFEKHQRVSHPTDSKIAKISITWDGSGNSPEPLQNSPESFVPEQGTGNREQGKDSANAERPTTLSHADRIWGEHLDWLAEKTGKAKGSLRSLVGRWRKEVGDAAVAAGFTAAQRASPSDPIAYLERTLKPPPKPEHPANRLLKELGLGPETGHREALDHRADVVELRTSATG